MTLYLRDLDHDGRRSTYDENIGKLSKAEFLDIIGATKIQTYRAAADRDTWNWGESRRLDTGAIGVVFLVDNSTSKRSLDNSYSNNSFKKSINNTLLYSRVICL